MIIPLNNKVLVKPDPKQDQIKETLSGFFIVQKEEEKPLTGTVVSGNDKIEKNDKVIYSRFGIDEIKEEGEVFHIVSSFNILGKFI